MRRSRSQFRRFYALSALLLGAVGAGAQTTTDYDDDDNGLIDIRTLAQLNAIRWDLDGNGTVAAGDATNYAGAFPSPASGMGCPATGCIGYELRNDLNFDTNGDGDVTSADSNTYTKWVSITGAFTAILDGNHHVIANFTSHNGSGDPGWVAMFDEVSGTIRNLGMANVDISHSQTSTRLSAIAVRVNTGGKVLACWSSGRMHHTYMGSGSHVGGLVSSVASGGRVGASWSTVRITGTGNNAGGFAASTYGTVIASYAANPEIAGDYPGGMFVVPEGSGSVTRSSYTRATGLRDSVSPYGGGHGWAPQPDNSGETAPDSYFDGDTTRTGDTQGDTTLGSRKTTAQLQGTTTFTGLYANWDDLDVNGDGSADEDPWDLGTSTQYPVINYNGMDTARQFNIQRPDEPPVIAAVAGRQVVPGIAIAPIQLRKAGGNGPLTFAASGLPAGLAFRGSGSGTCATTNTICGTPTTPGAYAVSVTATDNDDNYNDKGTLSINVNVLSDTDTVRVSATDPSPLVEGGLSGATLTLELGGGATFAAGASAGHFTLTTAVPGLTRSAVAASSGATTATLTLAHTGADFDAAGSLTVTVAAAATTATTALTTGSVAVLPRAQVNLSRTTLSLAEAPGATNANVGTYTVALGDAPTGTTTVTVASPEAAVTVDSDGTPLTRTLSFTQATAATPQTVTVTAQQDDDAANESVALSHSVSGRAQGTVTVSVTDDDAGVVVLDANPSTTAPNPGPLAAAEGGTASYTVRLSAAPTASVTVGVSSGDGGAVTVSPGSLTFTTSNWGTARTVTATAASDADALDEAVTVTHASSGGGYNGTSAELVVAVSDDERTGTDYDADEDGLIEISSLAQLNAVRWDLDGNGSVASTDQTNYTAAFSGASAGMGCPGVGGTATCRGYELAGDLSFDTDGDGDVDGSDTGSYTNWTPIPGTYAADFAGNGFAIHRLTISATGDAALFNRVSGTVSGLGLPNADVASTGTAATVRAGALAATVAPAGKVIASWSSGRVDGKQAGGLVGENDGWIGGSWSSATVFGTLAGSAVGGLAYRIDGVVVASYASGEATADEAAGLAWRNVGGTVRASYASGRVKGGAGAGLVGEDGGAGETYEYNVVATTGHAAGGCGGCPELSDAQLRAATAATGDFANWDDLDVDGDREGGEAPWHFGDNTQAPVLANRDQAPSFAQRGDYDVDDNGLIEVHTLAQLNAVRWDLNGDGAPASANAGRYGQAFVNHPADMGCPTDGDDIDDNDCLGYELANDLDFDTDGDGATHASGTSDSGDAYHNGGSGWDPIGPNASPNDSNNFNAVFDGNGHVIHNLFINRNRSYAALFAALRPTAVVRALGLRNAWVDGGWSSSTLAAHSWGRVAAAWSTGRVEAPGNLGGLVGVQNSGATMVASYSTAAVECTNSGASAHTGGLVGANNGGATVAASYATGAVTGTCPAGRKYGLTNTAGTVTASYWDTTQSGIEDDADEDPPEGRIAPHLRAPTAYTGLYADWDDQDVDGDGDAGEAADDAWDFGEAWQHPVLKFGGLDTALQFGLQPDLPPTFLPVSDVTVRNGFAIDPIPTPAIGGEGGTLTYTASGQPTGLVFDADGSGSCSAAHTICGTPSTDEVATVTVHAHDGDGNQANSDRATLTFTMTVVSPTAAISATSPAALTEATLDGATVTVTLTNTTFVSGVGPSGFQLTTGVSGLSVSSVATSGGATTATLTLAHDGTDFDSADTLAVTVLAAAHALKGSLATGTVAVATSQDATVSPGNLSLNEDPGSTSANEGTFTAVLDSAPAADTTVAVTSADGRAATVSPPELTFTTTNWSTAQTVTVTAQQDDDAENESTTVTLSVAGVGMLASVTVTVADDDLGTVLVDADPLTEALDPGPLLLDEGDAETYAVRLSARPTGDVAVSVASSDAGAVSVASESASLTFTTADWNSAQTVLVTAEQDSTAVDESARLTHIARGGGYNGASAELRVAVSDDERTGTDYDADEDGLIEISTLAQLNAVRWDLNGDGSVASTDQTNYNTAFPSASTGMGCPATSTGTARCTGYELANDLDFDTDGDGATHTSGTSDADDDYHNSGAGFAPIGNRSAGLEAVVDGNGHVVYNLFVNRTTTGNPGRDTGLFGAVGTAGVVRSLGVADAWVSSASDAVGGLVGRHYGRVEASWASGSVTGNSGVGGLAGSTDAGSAIVASHSSASVTVTGSAGGGGGLAGWISGDVAASYATGAVTGGAAQHGLANGSGAATASYWDLEASGVAASTRGAARTTSQLQSPTSATGPYAGWDRLDLNGDGDPSEAPWDFGASSQYPALRVGENGEASAIVQRGDYDLDDDGLIDIYTLAQLNAIRWDLNGDGAPASGNAGTYRKAFRNHQEDMGCPTDGDDADDNDCAGYELMNDLDFDTDGDGSTHASGTSDSGDAYHNSGSGWDPIGPNAVPTNSNNFNAVFDGGGHVIHNLFINRSRSYAGLFAAPRPAATVRALGLRNAWVDGGWSTGTLAGQSWGRMAAVWVTGRVSAPGNVGGLVGVQQWGGRIVASYSTASVACTNSAAAALTGGLVGDNKAGAEVVASYSTGAVTGACPTASKGGLFTGAGPGTASYWDTTLSGINDDMNATPPEGRSSSQLRTPTGYTGLYADWDDQDVDGDGMAGEAVDDDAWNFGDAFTHPVLKFGGLDTTLQFGQQPNTAPTFSGTVTDATVAKGAPVDLIQVPAATGGEGVGHTYSASGLPAGLVFDADGSGTCQQARTVCGTPSRAEVATVTVHAHDGDVNRADSDRAELTFTITVVTVTASITATSPAALTENNLNNATVTVALTNTTFGSGVTAASFTLDTNVPGLNVGSVATVSSGDTSATLTLSYSGANFNTARTLAVTVAAAAHALNGAVTTGTVAVAAGTGVRVAPPSLSLSEDPAAGGGTTANVGMYTVALESQPAGNVTVTATSADAAVHIDTDGTPLTYSLTFTPTNWETAQSVTATAQQDDDARDESVSVAHAVTGYPGVTTATSVTVAVDDDETAGITLDADPQTTTVDEAGPLALQELASGTNSASYTARLTAEPTATVTLTITSADTGAVTVNDTQPGAGTQNTLTFTSTNWATAQTVTLTAAQDADGVHESVVVTNAASTASTSEYTGVSATITATVQDDEAPGFVFDADPSTTNMDEAGPLNLDELAAGTNSASYAVRLTSQPTQDVTVSVSSPDTGAVTVGTSTLTFTTTNWDTRQTVALTAVQDLDGADEEVDIAHAASTASTSEYTGITGDFAAAVDDDETPAITLSPTSLNVNEEDDADYTVALATQPKGGGVTVAVTGAASGISASPTSLTFTATNWNTAQTVTASAVNDQNSANEQVTLTHTASGADYDTLTADLEVTALDDDTPSLRVTPTALTVPEAGSRTYTVRLNTQPSATVTVTVNGAASGVTVDTDGVATGDQNTLTFTDSTWETNQTVTVSAAADDNGVDEVVSLSHAAAGGDYGTITGAALPGVSVTADDDDVPAVLLDTDPQTTTVDEPGPVALKELAIATDNSENHTVRLSTEPSADVTVTITSADAGAVASSASALTFTSANWDTRQTVTLTAQQDADGVNESVVVTHAASTASTSEYTNVSATLTATVEDDEAPAFVFDADPSTAGVVDAAPLNLDELSTSPTNADDYSVKLSSQPTQDVTVAVSSPDTGAVTVGTSALTFTTANWNTPQTVTLTAQQDLDGADESVDIAHAASTATASEYTGITGDFEAAVDDDETAGLTLSPASLTVQERQSDTYTVVLDTEPKGGNVTVSISGAGDGITASPTRLVFTAANWNTARTVTARAADDANSANEVVTLTHAASGADYDGVSEDLEVTASDDDQPGLRVSPTQLTVREEAVATYRVRLNAQPSAAVTVTVGGATAKVGVDTDPDTTGDQTELAFDATDWNRWKTVRVRGIDDDDGADETASLTHAVAGASEYTGLALLARPGVAVTVDDRDVATVELSLSSLALSEGGGAAAEGTWTVRLANLRPTGPVSVAVTSGDPAVALTGAPVTLNFTTANWDTAQSVSARAVDDDNAASERVEVRHAASGANYGGAEAVLRVVVTDDEAPPDAPTGLAATPGDGSAALSWSNPENPSITRYEHRFAQEGAPLGEWRAVAGAGPNTTSLTVSGLINGRAYVFEVRAGNEIGDGPESRTAARLAAAPAAPATVPDAALAAAVRTVVGKSAEQPLTAGDLAQVLELDLSRPPPAPGRWRPPQTGGEAVKDLRGMEAMPNLRRLYLDNNEVADLSPLLGLVYLEHVSVRGNPLTSDSVFVHAAALRARGVEVLLDAATLATLADPGLRRAVEVALGKDPGAALTEGDLLTLSSLSADSAGVSSLSGIEAASRLQSLTLSGNAPAAGGAAMPLSPLAGLRSLTHLDLSDNGLTDVSALSGMTGLRSLLLAGNALEDLSPLSSLAGLEELTLSRNGLSNVSALSGLSSLRQLWLDGNGLESVKPLRGLASLVYLHLGDNRIADIEPLAWLADLRRLWLPGNVVEDVSALSGLWRLNRLDLERNRVSDVSPLAGLPELSQLRLGWNRVADVSALANHAALADSGTLGLRGNPLRASALEHQVPALRRAGAAVVVGWPAPLFPSASDASGRSGFVRVLNRSEAAGEALVEALDEAGRRVGPVRLALGPRAAAHFNSADLERGNAAKGLPAGVGRPTRGGWRLLVSSALDVEVLSYLRAPDGSLTVAHGELPRADGRLSAFFFNPGGDREQRSSLRVFNPGATASTAWPWGVDDAGRGRSAAGIEVPAGATASMSARDLESSRWGRRGLGDGEGRWRLRLGAPWPLSAQSLLEGPDGHLSNLSPAPVRAAWTLQANGNANGWDARADWSLRLPLFPPASASGRDGLARVVNLSPWEGWTQVAAVDDAGVRAGPVRLRLPPRAAVHFDSAALEAGNADQGPPVGVGEPTRGAWRLELRGNVAFAAAAYARHADGFLTSLHEAAPTASGSARVALFNPASNARQRSLLRLANDGAQPARATITGLDDSGAGAGPVSVTVPAGEALTFTAAQLEQGGENLAGALGDGEGKWRLTVAFDRPLTVMSLMESPDSRLSNLSATPRP